MVLFEDFVGFYDLTGFSVFSVPLSVDLDFKYIQKKHLLHKISKQIL